MPTFCVLFISRREPHVLFSSAPDPTGVCMTAQQSVCLSEHVCLCVCVCARAMKYVYTRVEKKKKKKKSHGAVISHSQRTNSSHMCCVIQVSTHRATIAARFLKHQHNVCPSRGVTEPGQGIPPWGVTEEEGGGWGFSVLLVQNQEVFSMKAAEPWGEVSPPLLLHFTFHASLNTSVLA